MNRVSSTDRGRAIRLPLVGTCVVGVVLVVALIGPGWLYSPANPVVGSPSTTLDFQGLNDLVSHVPSTGRQQAYFGWLGWCLVALTVLSMLAATVRSSPVAAGVVCIIALTGLASTLFAVKGSMTWSQFSDSLHDVRAGAFMVLGGYLAAAAGGLVAALRRASNRPHPTLTPR